MQSKPGVVKKLLETNQLLSRRVRKGEKFYIAFVVVVSLFLMLFLGVPLFTNLVEFAGAEEVRLSLSMSVFLLFSFDVFLILLRFQSKTLIEPYHLSVFPVGGSTRKKFEFTLLLMDYKSVIYGAVALVFVIFFAIELSPLKALLSVLLFGSSLIAVTTWVLVFLGLFRKLLGKFRASATMVFLFLVILFNTSIVTEKMQIFLTLPVVSYLGDGLYALRYGELESALTSIFLLISASGLGAIVFALVPNKD